MSPGWFRADQLIILICFGLLGELTFLHIGNGTDFILFGAAAGIALAVLSKNLISLLLFAFQDKARPRLDFREVKAAVARGLLIITPFTVVAVIAELVLGWNAVQAFTSAGLLTASAAGGMEMAKVSGPRVLSLALGSAGAFALMIAWMFATVLIGTAAG